MSKRKAPWMVCHRAFDPGPPIGWVSEDEQVFRAVRSQPLFTGVTKLDERLTLPGPGFLQIAGRGHWTSAITT